MILEKDIEFLEHFGKKGMKWGVRKAANQKTQKKSTTSKKLDTLDTVSKIATGGLLAATLLVAVGGYKLGQ